MKRVSNKPTEGNNQVLLQKIGGGTLIRVARESFCELRFEKGGAGSGALQDEEKASAKVLRQNRVWDN